MVGIPWTSSVLRDHIAALASKGQLCIESEAKTQHDVATNMLRQHQHDAVSYGINDDSGHWYDEDVHWDEESVIRDGEPRYDTQHGACVDTEPRHSPTANSITTTRRRKPRRPKRLGERMWSTFALTCSG
jgi:hypothetical protein